MMIDYCSGYCIEGLKPWLIYFFMRFGKSCKTNDFICCVFKDVT